MRLRFHLADRIPARTTGMLVAVGAIPSLAVFALDLHASGTALAQTAPQSPSPPSKTAVPAAALTPVASPAPTVSPTPAATPTSAVSPVPAIPESQVSNSSSRTETEEESVLVAGRGGTGLDAYLGSDLAYVRSQSGNTRKEAHKNGYLLGVQGIGSLYLANSALDLGGGWLYSKVRGGPARGSSLGPDYKYITTQSGFAEFAARYRFDGSLWELGPLGVVMFGDDSRFSPSRQKAEPNVYLGLSLLRTWRENALAARWGFKAYTDVTVSGRQVYVAGLTAHLGVSFLRATPEVRERVVERTIETRSDAIREVPRPLPPPPVEVTVYGPTFNFRKDRTALSKSDLAYARAFAELLKEFGESWSKVEVAGHADKRGPRELNERYSKKRATAVFEALKAAGIPEERMIISYHAFDKPLDRGARGLDLARNRRTEIFILTSKDSVELSKRMEDLRLRHHTPTTCLVPGCP